jgi:hypothetical protein
MTLLSDGTGSGSKKSLANGRLLLGPGVASGTSSAFAGGSPPISLPRSEKSTSSSTSSGFAEICSMAPAIADEPDTADAGGGTDASGAADAGGGACGRCASTDCKVGRLGRGGWAVVLHDPASDADAGPGVFGEAALSEEFTRRGGRRAGVAANTAGFEGAAPGAEPLATVSEAGAAIASASSRICMTLVSCNRHESTRFRYAA